MVLIPTCLEDINLSWCNAAFGDKLKGKLTKATTAPLGSGAQGWTATAAQIDLEYEQPKHADDPVGLFVKIGKEDPMFRAPYEREADFYLNWAHKSQLATPRCFFAEVDSAGRFLLILENLSPLGYKMGHGWDGASFETVKDMAVLIAKFHAHWRDRREEMSHLTDGYQLPWGKTPETDYEEFHARVSEGAQYQLSLYDEGTKKTPYEQFWVTVLPPKEKMEPILTKLMDRENTRNLFTKYRAIPRTVCHGDYRPENVMFLENSPTPMVVVDFQLLHWGPGVRDIAFLISYGWDWEVVKEREEELVRIYHEHLDLPGYSFEQCWEDYRICRFWVSLQFMMPEGFAKEMGKTLSPETDPNTWKFMTINVTRMLPVPVWIKLDELMH